MGIYRYGYMREQVVFGPSRCVFPTCSAKNDLLAV